MGYVDQGWLQKDGKYSIKSGYIWRLGRTEKWPWSRWIWNKRNIPKHSFICWLAGHGRLLTRMRMRKMGITQDTMCTICDRAPETVEHLFFECQFSKECMKIIVNWLSIGIQNFTLQGIWRRLTRGIKGEECRNQMNAILVALIYYIWKARNEALWHQRVPKPGKVCAQVQQECRLRLENNDRKEGRK
ncbi:PREDICTED: uncharacterized protein LOC109218607 [Nicotiana attenuata]|uniref:uncharacterized protein LOC109218607 n=1 Tax=Nicotiana attenuata TaxID=49451 RepID=UPI00090567B8|nr:PREDICTED: uncharacterized protein LOC109218607 [Nicotiana attenuata]